MPRLSIVMGRVRARSHLHRKNGFEPGSGEEPPRFVTASLNVNYLKPTPQGALLKAVGKVEEIHPKKWKVSVDVFADDTSFAQLGKLSASLCQQHLHRNNGIDQKADCPVQSAFLRLNSSAFVS